VKVTIVPGTSPVTVALVAPAPALAGVPPDDAVNVYPVSALPPFATGGVHDTRAEVESMSTAETPVGGPGTETTTSVAVVAAVIAPLWPEIMNV
jgi:hypothetical protein